MCSGSRLCIITYLAPGCLQGAEGLIHGASTTPEGSTACCQQASSAATGPTAPASKARSASLRRQACPGLHGRGGGGG